MRKKCVFFGPNALALWRVGSVRWQMAGTICALLTFLGSALPVWSTPESSIAPVSFRKEIAPLLQRRCATCHNEETAKGGYRLDTFAGLLTAGDSELAPIVAGKPAESELQQLLLEPNAHDRMPQKTDPLPASEIALIERWINEGAKFDGETPEQLIVELARETLLRSAPALYSRPVPVTALAYSPDASQLASPGYYELLIWNVADASLAQRVSGLPERIHAIAWHPAEKIIAIAGGSPGQWGAVVLLDGRAGFQVRFLCDLPEVALSVAFSPDGNRLLAGCGDRSARLFEVPSGKQIRVWRQHADWVQVVRFSADGKRFASGSRDRTVRVYSTSKGQLETTYADHGAPLTDLAFSNDSTHLVSIARGKSVHLWEADSGKRNSEFTGSGSDLQKIEVLGGRLVSAAADATVFIHDLGNRLPLFALNGHHDQVQSIAVASNRAMATGSHDGEIIVWETHCGTWTQRFLAVPTAPLR